MNVISHHPSKFVKLSRILSAIEYHTLYSNNIMFSYSVGQLVKLERLSVSGNLLMSLPETIGSLQNVSDLSDGLYSAISRNSKKCAS